MRFGVLLFLSASIFAFWITDNSYNPDTKETAALLRRPSSDEVKASSTKNSYANLRCPSEAEFLKWSKELNIDPIEGPSLDRGCAENNFRNQLARVLALANDIKFEFPRQFAPTVQHQFKNTYDYIRANTNKLRLDLNQVGSVARNLVLQKQIELGRIFFNEEPLQALSILVHEARHSDPNDQGHVLCRVGDILKTQGGCDPFFSIKSEEAGAYGYGVIYDLALARHSKNLDRAEKELALTSAFSSLGTRFNEFSGALAQHIDIIVVLLEDGSLGWIHPFTLQLVPLAIKLPETQEPITRIEFSNRTNGLYVYTQSGRFFEWGQWKKPGIPYGGAAITKNDRLKEFSRQYVPFNTDRTFFVTLKTDGTLEYLKYNPEINKTEVLPYPIIDRRDRPPSQIPDLKAFSIGHGFNSYFLDHQGVLSRAPQFGNEPDFIEISEVQSPGGWQKLTSGVFYEDLILIDSEGRIKQVDLQFKENTDSDSDQVFSQKPFYFQSENFAEKYQQGLSLHAVLDRSGHLKVQNIRVPDSDLILRYDKRIIDFAVTRITKVNSSVYQNTDSFLELKRRCKLASIVKNQIGYSGAIGMSEDSKVIFASPDGKCTPLADGKRYNFAELLAVDAVEKDESRPYPDVRLKLSNQYGKIILYPYTRSNLDHNK